MLRRKLVGSWDGQLRQSTVFDKAVLEISDDNNLTRKCYNLQAKMAIENVKGVGDFVKYGVLKLFVFLTYIISHIYDYVTYPFYFIYYHPWLTRQYKKEDHARREDRDDCIVFHSLCAPTALNVTMERNGLDTMDKVFDYVR